MKDFAPTVIVDTREQTPLAFPTFPTRQGTLQSGDYSFAGGEHLFSIERKSIADLVQSLTTERDRFTRELERLRGYPFARLLIIGSIDDIEQGRYRSKASPKALLHSIYSIEAKFIPVTFAPTPEAAAALVERWIYWSARAVMQAAERIGAA